MNTHLRWYRVAVRGHTEELSYVLARNTLDAARRVVAYFAEQDVVISSHDVIVDCINPPNSDAEP